MSIAVIGAGYAGLAAAVVLADRGLQVDVFEASRTLGGRARTVEIDGRRLDNGQHILLGAYSHTLALMDRVGVPADSLYRHALRLDYPAGSVCPPPGYRHPCTWRQLWLVPGD
jgi:predicted NAD/FAD-binding protein